MGAHVGLYERHLLLIPISHNKKGHLEVAPWALSRAFFYGIQRSQKKREAPLDKVEGGISLPEKRRGPPRYQALLSFRGIFISCE
jgi:hypothetical protein